MVKEAFLHVYNHFPCYREKLKFQLASFQRNESTLKCQSLCLWVVALDRNPAQVCQRLEQEITSTLSSEWLIMLHESSETLMFSVPDTQVQDVLLKCYGVFFLWFITLHIPTCTERHLKHTGSLLVNKNQIPFQPPVLPGQSASEEEQQDQGKSQKVTPCKLRIRRPSHQSFQSSPKPCNRLPLLRLN